MQFGVRDLQARLAALGHHPGPIDGIRGRRTDQATAEGMEARGVKTKAGLFGSTGLHRIHWHWTAGAAGVIELERQHYHWIVGASEVVAGLLPPEANVAPLRGAYVAHTLNANSGAIGIAIDAMANAKERPFSWGSEPMTEAQVEAMLQLTADLCLVHDIPVSRFSTLSHAEVQPTLGIAQRWKWDINILPGMDAPGDPVAVGDVLRARLSAILAERAGAVPPTVAPATEPGLRHQLARIREAVDVIEEVML